MQRRLLSGTYECSLDNRFRLAIPARVRDPFADGAIVSRWVDDDCLVVVPRLEWRELVDETFQTMSVLDRDQRDLRREMFGSAWEQDALDKQGRILIPQWLREGYGLQDTVTVVGLGDYLELWRPEKLAERTAAVRREGVSALAKRLADRVS